MKILTIAFLFFSSCPGWACIFLNVTAYQKMCQGVTCGQPKAEPVRIQVNFDAKGEAVLNERQPAGDVEVQYSLFVRSIPQNKSYYIKISTSFWRQGHPSMHSEKSEFVYNLEKFDPLSLSGDSMISGGYQWTPLMKIEPTDQTGSCAEGSEEPNA